MTTLHNLSNLLHNWPCIECYLFELRTRKRLFAWQCNSVPKTNVLFLNLSPKTSPGIPWWACNKNNFPKRLAAKKIDWHDALDLSVSFTFCDRQWKSVFHVIRVGIFYAWKTWKLYPPGKKHLFVYLGNWILIFLISFSRSTGNH